MSCQTHYHSSEALGLFQKIKKALLHLNTAVPGLFSVQCFIKPALGTSVAAGILSVIFRNTKRKLFQISLIQTGGSNDIIRLSKGKGHSDPELFCPWLKNPRT